MKAALLIVLSLSALAMAGPAFNKNVNNNQDNNQIGFNNQFTTNNQFNQEQQYKGQQWNEQDKTQSIELLKQWCYSSQMSQPELTSSFKRLVQVIKSQPLDKTTEAAVMSERICQQAQQQQKSDKTSGAGAVDAQAHELIKDVYMDALIACEKRECTQQLIKIIESQQVDTIRASYYMTRLAVTESEKGIAKDTEEIKQLAESFIQQQPLAQQSEAIERQKLFAVTSLIGKSLKSKPEQQDLKQVAEQVAKTIVQRYIKCVSESEVREFQQQQPQQQQPQLVKKIAKRNAALKALANIPGWMLKQCQDVQQVVEEIAMNKQELKTSRQSAIECLEQNEQVVQKLKQLTFDQEEPIEVRVAAYRALMTSVYAGVQQQEQKQQLATEIVDSIVKHCEESRNQQQDDQFVLYAISHLDNIRTSQQQEHQAIKECIAKNKQHYMQIQLLVKKFKQQLSGDFSALRKYTRNYKLEQEFNQIESGLVLEGDLVYESQNNKQHYAGLLPKMVRVNMSMPVMGKTVNVIEITLRQNQMDEELLGALKLAKFTGAESVSKVVDSFKQSAERQQQQQQQQQQYNNQYNTQKSEQKNVEGDLCVKIDGQTVVYLSVDDFKTEMRMQGTQMHQRNTRSVQYTSESIVEQIVEYLKQKPVSFNRGFNFNVNQRIAKLLDVEANIIAGLRFDSRVKGQSAKNFEIEAHVEPRVGFEAIVGPAKLSSKKLMQRFSTKTAFGLRYRVVEGQEAELEIQLPMETMELFTIESQLVEKSQSRQHSYTYLPESIYGQEDIYQTYYPMMSNGYNSNRLVEKRSIFNNNNDDDKITKKIEKIVKLGYGKAQFEQKFETPEQVARATGLRGKLRLMASPKDMSFVCQAIVQKYEPEMQGYRVQIKSVEQRQGQEQEYLLKVSTPNSQVDRTMQIRLVKQQTQQRTYLKSEIQSPLMSGQVMCELVHDGRQYAIKVEAASTRVQATKQWRHLFECGMQRQQVARGMSGQLTFKPYISIESTQLRRPVQLQGLVSYQQSPKTVINYELKCPTTGDFLQGKVIVDAREASQYQKRGNYRRSMRSPVELVFTQDFTFTSEIVAQIGQQACKVHKMLDWDSQRVAVNGNFVVSHKNIRHQQEESQYMMSMKVNQEQQLVQVSRKCPQQERKEFRFTLQSEIKKSNPIAHIMMVELRTNKRQSTGLQSVVAYKHKLDIQQVAAKKLDVQAQMEILDTERQVNEKVNGRARLGLERHQKTCQVELSTRGKQCKVQVEFVSLDQHVIEVVFQGQQYQHKTQIRADQRQFALQSRTDKRSQMIHKCVVEISKDQEKECTIVFELPLQRCHLAADLKLNSGKLSSLAIQTPRFASKGEFVFEKLAGGRSSYFGKRDTSRQIWQQLMPVQNLRIKTDLKDSLKNQQYWIESQYNGMDKDQKSFFRFESPTHRFDTEFDPREEQTTVGMFRRQQPLFGINQQQLYNTKDSSIVDKLYQNLHQGHQALDLGNKMWQLRSIISSPANVESMKQRFRRSLFQYADRRQSHHNQINYEPEEERLSVEHESRVQGFEPTRFTGNFATNFQSNMQKPGKLSLNSQWMDFDLEAKPFDGEDSHCRVSALSRHRRSPFRKHESEISYKKGQGYKGHMKHHDSKDKRHAMEFESDSESPKKWAKLAYESEKLGKGQWEHKWRKHVTKRSNQQRDVDQLDQLDQSDDKFEEDVYDNSIKFSHQKPESRFMHETLFNWQEPTRFSGRIRRDVSDYLSLADKRVEQEQRRRYNTIDYLKHVNARLQSTTQKDQADLLKLDFDYQPLQHARLNVHMPEEMLHQTTFEMSPRERLYKLQSKLYNKRTQEPHYELMAQTKPLVAGLATAEQEPVYFLNQQHQMLESPIRNTIYSQLFKQPLKLDYTDKFGRVARFDYDQSPMVSTRYAGLRQKRAAVYLKDEQNDFEHETTYDFYPEAHLGKFAARHQTERRQPADLNIKTMTKYGPVIVRVDSDDKIQALDIVSPIIDAKIVAENTKTGYGAQLIKVQVDNKQQKVQLAKVLRKIDLLHKCELVDKLVKKFDSSRFEHQTELLVSIVDAIFKVKSETLVDQRPIVIVEGEYNKSQDKAFVKIDGECAKGRMVIDLVAKSADLVLEVDDKRTVQHMTRIQRVSEKFYSIESQTSYKGRPLCNLKGKISSKVFDPEHLFTVSRRQQEECQYQGQDHISTFEAIIYEPEQYQVVGEFDCCKKEARIVIKNEEELKVQETHLKFDQKTESIIINSRSTCQEGQIYLAKAKLSLPALVQSRKCYRNAQSCASEAMFQGESGNYLAKYVPGEFVSVATPFGKQSYKLY